MRWVPDIEENENRKDEGGLKDIKIPLMRGQIAVESSAKLDHSIY